MATTTDETPVKAPAASAMTPAAKVPVRMGLAPTSFDEGYRMAQLMASSDLVPKNFKNKAADVLVAIELGIELGLAPMQALQSIAVINGRPSVWGDGFLALIMACPFYRDHDEYYEVDGKRKDGVTADDLKKDTTAAVCTFLRSNKATPVTRRFTVAQAKKANLLGKEGPWQQYPDRMLSMRARSFAGRDCFPDVLRGLVTAEEAQDIPIDTTVTAAPVREVKRLSEQVSETAQTAPESDAVPYAGVKVAKVDVIDKPGEERYFLVTFDNDKAVEVSSAADALELEKFVSTDHKLNVTVKTGVLASFAIAD
jgi:hypothetical protein